MQSPDNQIGLVTLIIMTRLPYEKEKKKKRKKKKKEKISFCKIIVLIRTYLNDITQE